MSYFIMTHCMIYIFTFFFFFLLLPPLFFFFFFFNDTATTEIYTLSLHDALPIYGRAPQLAIHGARLSRSRGAQHDRERRRSEEHTSELQSPCNLVCRLLLEKKKKKKKKYDPQLTNY